MTTKQQTAAYTECREVPPCELKPGDLVRMPWGFQKMVRVEITETHYTVFPAPDDYGTVNWVKSHICNWPFVATGNKAPNGSATILRDGTRY